MPRLAAGYCLCRLPPRAQGDDSSPGGTSITHSCGTAAAAILR
uniref:Uncharacterized protein n=1 Tax=Arundo donax TaxID=35708 RepID=A0A0A9C6K0_ARUDO